MPRVFGYLVARDPADQAAQTAALRAFVAEHLPGHTWADVLVDDPSAASRSLTNRPAGFRLVTTGPERGDAIVVSRLDAFLDTRDATWTLRYWEAIKVAAHVVGSSRVVLDNVTPLGRHSLFIAQAFQEVEHLRASERACAAWQKRRQRNKQANQHAGFGFKLIGRQNQRHAVPDPKERAVMADIVRLRAEGKTWDAIYYQFIFDGVTTRKGKEWSRTSIQRAYAAELRLRAAEQGEPACA